MSKTTPITMLFETYLEALKNFNQNLDTHSALKTSKAWLEYSALRDARYQKR